MKIVKSKNERKARPRLYVVKWRIIFRLNSAKLDSRKSLSNPTQVIILALLVMLITRTRIDNWEKSKPSTFFYALFPKDVQLQQWQNRKSTIVSTARENEGGLSKWTWPKQQIKKQHSKIALTPRTLARESITNSGGTRSGEIERGQEKVERDAELDTARYSAVAGRGPDRKLRRRHKWRKKNESGLPIEKKSSRARYPTAVQGRGRGDAEGIPLWKGEG